MNRDIALLQLMHARGLGVKTLGRLLRRLHHEQYPVEDFVNAPSDEHICAFKLPPGSATAIKEGYDQACELYEDLQRNDIRLISLGDTLYPSRLSDILGDSAPPVLCVRGNLLLLDQKAVGFCGARKASESAYTTAGAMARQLARQSVNIVSGYAPGIDHASHWAALEAGGTTTIILAIGILHFTMKEDLGALITDSNVLVLSEFLPRLGWVARNAMQRNRTICALSDAMILVESDLKGGTFEAGRAALELQRPLFVVDYEDTNISAPGNKHFLRRGATPITVSTQGEFDLAPVLKTLENGSNGASQASLFD